VERPEDLADADLVILPGTKTTVADLAWLRERGLAGAIARRAAEGRMVLGICGGYQMLGVAIHDPDRVESPIGSTEGLQLLPVETNFVARKTTLRVRARVNRTGGPFDAASGAELSVYEIHAGETVVSPANAEPVRQPFALAARGGIAVDQHDGAVNSGGNVVGTSLHGLFANDQLRRALLTFLTTAKGIASDPRWGAPDPVSDRYERLADVVGAALDVPAIAKLAALEYPKSPRRRVDRRNSA